MSAPAATYDPVRELTLATRRIQGFEIVRRVGPVPHDFVDHIIVRRYAGDEADGGERKRRLAETIVQALTALEAGSDAPAPPPLHNRRGLTVAELKAWIRGLPDEDLNGEPHDVWVQTVPGLSSPIVGIVPLNLRDGRHCDVLLQTREGAAR